MADYDNDPVLQKYKFPVQKTVDSDKKRLAAILDKIEQEKASKLLIKSALSGQVLNKKIVFNDPIPPKKFKNEISKPKPKSKAEPELSLKCKQLFDDDGDDGLDGDESIKLDIPSKRFKNSKESKIIDLQSRFAHDPRFKIDDKFVEDETENPLEGTSITETEKELDILEELLGKPLKRKVKQSDEKQLTNSIIIPRYDPSKPESQKFKIRKVDKLEPYQLPDEKDDDQGGDRPEVSKERFYEISETFKKDFTDDQTDGQSFSLTAMFGRPVADIPETNDNLGAVKSKLGKLDDQTSKKKISKSKSTKRSKSKQDSDSEPDDDDDEDEDQDEDGDEDEDDKVDEEEEEEQDEISKSKKKGKKEKKVDKSIKKRNTDVLMVPKKPVDSESINPKRANHLKGKSKVSNPLLKYERFCFTENDGRLTSETFYNVSRIKSHIAAWKEKKLVMTTALTKKRRHFKHVSKLVTALENGDTRDKDLKLKYRIYKETTKKH